MQGRSKINLHVKFRLEYEHIFNVGSNARRKASHRVFSFSSIPLIILDGVIGPCINNANKASSIMSKC